MKYMGSKNRIAKHILPIMLQHKKEHQCWVEPFVGGGNIIDKVTGNRIGADINPYVIEALVAIRDNVHDLPKTNLEFTENDYVKLKTDDTYKYKGYAGFAFSYGGKWLGGWSRNKKVNRDYVAESYRNALKQSKNIQNVEFLTTSYDRLILPKTSFIYCDPPYKNTTKYKTNFDYEAFWQWCRDKSKENHTVYVSEYNAPEDFICVWQGQINSSLTKNTGGKKGLEKLFVLT